MEKGYFLYVCQNPDCDEIWCGDDPLLNQGSDECFCGWETEPGFVRV